MGDRRQGDRRETSFLQRKVAISLKDLIYLCIIFVIIVAGIIVCKITRNKSYDEGYDAGYLEASETVLEEYYYNQYLELDGE